MSAPAPLPGVFPAELEALAAQARADVDAATTGDTADMPGWCRRLADARRAESAVYEMAREHTTPDSLMWWALGSAIRACQAHANRLISHAIQFEQESR